jgi:ribonuclease HI
LNAKISCYIAAHATINFFGRPLSHRPPKACHHFRIIYTDGACTNNGQVAAKAEIGTAYGNDDSSQLSKPVTDMVDNFPLRLN